MNFEGLNSGHASAIVKVLKKQSVVSFILTTDY